MKNLFDPQDAAEMASRIEKLSPETQQLWGKMNVAKMLAHCNKSLETSIGLNTIPRIFIGRIIAPLMRKNVLGEKPFGKNSPTDKTYMFPENIDFSEQKLKVKNSLQQFTQGGKEKCTTYPHPFFGHFSPEEWAIFQWKHLDHHLRQFGA